ncbi:2-dehydro-3-deoxygalactonokinase [Aureimonas endophytica]|uniref:2-dehydro-3-deoxygalactonokinase n=1 Tax=Aureimonas endophytica TaxID=2027858 RepID=A0A916ZBF7_9HYPH|nr:2-dehydro-3-deoxygalactonokinase [Aureimonas endophytica]GGD86218.1 2-dehydro-3-deoxygalactonokinase [Aureimonas endophytica]
MASETVPFCAAADWGTSSFRLWLLARDGTVLGEKRSREGMQSAVAAGGFAAVLETHLGALGAAPDLPVIVCGMAGAKQGWVEVPYVDAPAPFEAIAAGALPVPGVARDVRILPGVAQRDAARPDVMRGEETQIVGLGREGLVCLPGTHSKWAAVRAGRIEAFSTFMTGEVFALLAEQSILRHTVGADRDALAHAEAFGRGVEAGLNEPELLLNRLFALRAGPLLGLSEGAEAAARLSGLLIGSEIAGARSLLPGERSVVLVVSGPLADLYAAALEVAGFEVAKADADAAVRQGLLAAAECCFPIETETRS